MYIRRFKYKPDDVDCRLCTEFKKRKCTLEGCPWIAERIEAGVVSYAEAVMKCSLLTAYFGTDWLIWWIPIPEHSGLMNGTGTEWNGLVISWATTPGAILQPTMQHCTC